MVYLFGIISLLLFIGFLVTVFRKQDRYSCSGDDRRAFCLILIVLCFFVIIVLSFIWLFTYTDGITTIADLEAFHDFTLESFEYTANKTENVKIYVSEESLFDAGYLGQGMVVSDRVSELRDKVDWYNSELSRNRQYNSNLITRYTVPRAPSRLGYITLEEK